MVVVLQSYLSGQVDATMTMDYIRAVQIATKIPLSKTAQLPDDFEVMALVVALRQAVRSNLFKQEERLMKELTENK
jgi:hypothetical protein